MLLLYDLPGSTPTPSPHLPCSSDSCPVQTAKMSVRNLRAMFENKTQDSPPDRGRSPGVSSSTNESACLFCPSQLLSSPSIHCALLPPITTKHSAPKSLCNNSNLLENGPSNFCAHAPPRPLLTRFLCPSRHRVASSPFQGPHKLRGNREGRPHRPPTTEPKRGLNLQYIWEEAQW